MTITLKDFDSEYSFSDFREPGNGDINITDKGFLNAMQNLFNRFTVVDAAVCEDIDDEDRHWLVVNFKEPDFEDWALERLCKGIMFYDNCMIFEVGAIEL